MSSIGKYAAVLLFGLTFGMLTLLALEIASQPEVPIIHDVCFWDKSEIKCKSVPFYEDTVVWNGQMRAIQPDGSVYYVDEVVLVGPCRTECEVY